ncbi:DUF4129 domain-containing protein [Mycobacteroides immunogenum]|uniref:Protein-glutamine gamma-glutamyltransferase-like C-terminal domain-containing protein n=1 Tax=Mycobacteroides immunogenum TaxID=83262 RepID=A0A7V8RV57_9MYCO|nr:DUF4129 domain-containing protein [Mycobacteroides immunogenum]AMT70629.1 hypothetical protein ABG82_10235 [Mycobacteroides immunogenum]ANO03737.1 hypothetical protein BAB75_10420 [Mycobacteroides immunogenum]KIU38211.1 hypothetical protein TL11_23740 [Mycobacteroides immunogenum]KPG04599.1 hypothetical protein AN909_22850 [Mycobacteroides immunogenum]KPG05262.1 hypothetical protein AN908_22730 [Mycobacteroides immunogenum]
MNSADKLFLRAAGLIALVVLSVAALRSYLPEVAALPPPEKPRPQPHSIALQLVLCGAISIVILLSLRRRRPKLPLPQESPPYLRLRGLTRREALIAAATVLVLVGTVWTSLHLIGPAGHGPPPEPASRSSEPRAPEAESHTPGAVSPRQDPALPMVALGLALGGIAVAVFVLRRRDPDDTDAETDPSAEPGAAAGTSRSLAHLVELGLAEVAEPGRDPRASIIACYAAMEQGLTAAPEAAPLASDTPSEVLQRAVHIGALQSAAGTRLVSLFSEARFSPHEMTQADRQAAARWLQAVLDDLRSRQ